MQQVYLVHSGQALLSNVVCFRSSCECCFTCLGQSCIVCHQGMAGDDASSIGSDLGITSKPRWFKRRRNAECVGSGCAYSFNDLSEFGGSIADCNEEGGIGMPLLIDFDDVSEDVFIFSWFQVMLPHAFGWVGHINVLAYYCGLKWFSECISNCRFVAVAPLCKILGGSNGTSCISKHIRVVGPVATHAINVDGDFKFVELHECDNVSVFATAPTYVETCTVPSNCHSPTARASVEFAFGVNRFNILKG